MRFSDDSRIHAHFPPDAERGIVHIQEARLLPGRAFARVYAE